MAFANQFAHAARTSLQALEKERAALMQAVLGEPGAETPPLQQMTEDRRSRLPPALHCAWEAVLHLLLALGEEMNIRPDNSCWVAWGCVQVACTG